MGSPAATAAEGEAVLVAAADEEEAALVAAADEEGAEGYASAWAGEGDTEVDMGIGMGMGMISCPTLMPNSFSKDLCVSLSHFQHLKF